MASKTLCYLLILVSISVFYCEGLFVNVNEGAKKCWLEEVPKNTLVLIKWKASIVQPGTETEDSQKPIGMRVTVEDPFANVKQRYTKIK